MRFEEVGGLEAGAPLTVKGFPIGRVAEIAIARSADRVEDVAFEVLIDVDDRYRLAPEDARLRIVQPLPTSPASLALVAGSVTLTDPEGFGAARLSAAIPPREDGLVDRALGVLDGAETAVASLAAAGPAVAEAVAGLDEDLAPILADLAVAAAAARELATAMEVEGPLMLEPLVTRLADRLEAALDRAETRLLADFDTLSTESRALVADGRAFLAQAEASAATLGARTEALSMVAERELETLSASLTETSAEARAAAANLRALAGPEEARAVRSSLRDVERVLSQLSADLPGLLDDLAATTHQLRRLSRDLARDPDAALFGDRR